jgi:exonuclease VII small subunit
MCDQRERLIGYLYDEDGDAAERGALDAHLVQCADCRREIQDLRRVRADLLAWDVPGTPDVWRPFSAQEPRAWWTQVPAWALASAAGLLLMAGLAGGVSARAFAPAPAPLVVEAPTRSDGAGGVTPTDLAVAQERILEIVRLELEQRARPAATRSADVRLTNANVSDGALRHVDELSRDSTMLEAVSMIYEQSLADRSRIDQRLKQLQQQVDQLMNLAMAAGTQSPGGSPR